MSLRYTCQLIIAACRPVVGANEDSQHHLLGPPHPPYHTARRELGFSRGGIKLRSVSYWAWLAPNAKADWCQARSSWACMVCCKSDVWQCHVVVAQTVSQSCGGSTNSQSVSKKICHFKTSPDDTTLQDSCPEQTKEVILGVYTILHIWVV